MPDISTNENLIAIKERQCTTSTRALKHGILYNRDQQHGVGTGIATHYGAKGVAVFGDNIDVQRSSWKHGLPSQDAGTTPAQRAFDAVSGQLQESSQTIQLAYIDMNGKHSHHVNRVMRGRFAFIARREYVSLQAIARETDLHADVRRYGRDMARCALLRLGDGHL